ncbi:MAG: hypothetical protein A3A98_01740 [Candidatus Staskawiczbacteria bacterium RIFCSPLOWO2_01_FULL_40_39]|uniref:Uncharacterized protein n=1 Tax=Candidatus Staskawiczbacteria bacterium RIFCSPHIGHO2_01_FULL_39_25 TaxID=1802202 RepID=A0A1G2HQ86_9BACT|nr:MAG: hypothetical protein A2730_01895 [Candidatus Staskawiczbacteria bacterium RIFCSPHIGHO2_01_FULL_39_25]OGZ72694.1 MAG: hypothetical protein A3A98_01740 [Candidatus Staskawiczbacteria bacterium RIFCSPLOWO2_01_FULL_40_39]OGZ75550.1 MAG: hypothetical protein A3I87_02670 [Candidatus Staskawiczbacteria bacterium RIFCSPLOWO2_02_FULL_39_8]
MSIFFKSRAKQKRTTANLILQNREAAIRLPSGTEISFKTHWGAVRDVRRFVGQKSKCFIVEYIYNHAKTYFVEN